ncbi:anti-sigma factor [Flexivirga alba]|uniref:Regulator of SigK n=1 Tax=Flexivirga alba TaxID=702742 RepID=A0ABW2AF24_9MICO
MTDDHIDTIDYAMDSLDDVSRRRADQHLAHCAQCRAEVADWREATAGLGASVVPVSPPPALREAVLASAARVPQDDIGSASDDQAMSSSPSRRRTGRWLLAAAAAVVVLVGGGITVATKPWSNNPTTVSAVEQVERAPDAQNATAPAPEGSLVMTTSVKLGRAVATLRGVPAPAAGKVYQAWIITPKGPVSAGLLQPGKPTLLVGTITGAKAAAVTVEPTGGSKQPTTKPIASVSMT